MTVSFLKESRITPSVTSSGVTGDIAELTGGESKESTTPTPTNETGGSETVVPRISTSLPTVLIVQPCR